MKTKVLNLDAKDAGEIELNDSIFGLEPRKDLLQRVIVWQLAKRRAGTHKVLTRAEVNRTKKKVYKQKGTGQARHGARSAPLFRRQCEGHGPGAAQPRIRSSQEGPRAWLPQARPVVEGQSRRDRRRSMQREGRHEIKTKNLAGRQFGKLGVGSALIVDSEFEGKNSSERPQSARHVALLPGGRPQRLRHPEA